MAGIVSFDNAFQGKRVLVTGHTGFKGSWMVLWLTKLNAKVTGYSLPAPTTPSMFELCNIDELIDHNIGDVNNGEAVNAIVSKVKPDLIIHMAAQPLVQHSYQEPLSTLSTNVIGTANVLEAARKLNHKCAVVVVTSDKCYENQEWVWGYRETEPLGGHDPYSMSKAAAELVVSSWRNSFFSKAESPILLASARAGNVIGGGDWAAGRIIKDCVEAYSQKRPVVLRNPAATRPWQHVLEPLSGYLWLAAKLMRSNKGKYDEAWNFGPQPDSVWPVSKLVEAFSDKWQGHGWTLDNGHHPHEAMSLGLSIEKARYKLGWVPTWDLAKTLDHTVDWYRAWIEKSDDLKVLSLAQIDAYDKAALSAKNAWISVKA